MYPLPMSDTSGGFNKGVAAWTAVVAALTAALTLWINGVTGLRQDELFNPGQVTSGTTGVPVSGVRLG